MIVAARLTAFGVHHANIQLEQAPRNPLWRSPLFRRLYLLFFVLFSLLVLVPAWTVYYFPRSQRPFPSWPLQRCLRVRWSRHLSTVVAKCEIDYLGRNLDVPLVSRRSADNRYAECASGHCSAEVVRYAKANT